MMQRTESSNILGVNICTFGDEQFDNFTITFISDPMQRSHTFVLRIHIRSSSQVLFDGFDISIISIINN